MKVNEIDDIFFTIHIQRGQMIHLYNYKIYIY